MKIKRTIIVTLLLALLVLSGCGEVYSNELPTNENTSNDIIFGTRFKRIPGRDDLVFDLDTKNVYYMFSVDYSVGWQSGVARGFLGDYIGVHGHNCKYIDGEITEYEYLNGKFIYY